MKQKINGNEQIGASLKMVWESFIVSQASKGVSDVTTLQHTKRKATDYQIPLNFRDRYGIIFSLHEVHISLGRVSVFRA